MTRMLEDEDSADEEFWNQDAFKEEHEDSEYESEEEVADVFDKDFDEEETSEDEEEVEVRTERRRKTMKAPERNEATKKKKQGASDTAFTAAAAGGSGAYQEQEQQRQEQQTATTEPAVVIPQELRVSSRASAKEIRERSEALQRERKSRPQIVRPKVEYVVPTMEEMIKEAKITEKKNLIELEHLLHLEEEQKKKNQMMDRKKRYDGPAIRQRSLKGDKPGKIVYELIRGAVSERDAPEFYLRSEDQAPSTSAKEEKICAITGLPAKYRDPKSGLYYATIDAFKQLRLQQEKKEAEEKENATIDVEVKVEDGQEQEREQPPTRRSIWDPPIPGALTHREIAQIAKKKAEKEEQAAMQAFLKQQEEAKAAAAALRREKQGKPAKVAPQAKRTKAQIKKAKEAMKREEEENKDLRGPGRWLSLKTILARPELDVPATGPRYPRPVLEGFSKPGIPQYVVPTPKSIDERPLDEKDIKIEQPNFDNGNRGATIAVVGGEDTVEIEGIHSRDMDHIDACDIMAIEDNEEEDDAMTNSDDFTVEDASDDEEDDEGTIEEDERAALEEDDERLNITAEEEKNALEDEANIPIEELMRRYQSNNRQFGQIEPSPSPENSSDFDRDEDEDDSEDNESTLEEDEKALQEDEDMLDADEEKKRLEDEANMPIEELMARYQQQQNKG